MSELPEELPASWTIAPLPELIGPKGIFVDGDWVESKDQDPDGEIRLIQLADIGDGEFRNRSARFLTAEKAVELRCTYLQEGDLLVARMPDPLGRCCIFPLRQEQRFVTVVDVCIVRPGSTALDIRFLMYAINSLGVRSDIAALQSGSTRKRISRGNLATVGIPIAPTREQHRIVAKIEELFSELDKAVESLTLARAQLKTYRQALLKAAFEGKLTAGWRAANPDKLEPPETLLARIRAEREARYKQALADWRKAVAKWQAKGEVGRKPTKPRPFNVDLSAVADGVGSMEKLPFGWVWLRLHELFDESPKNGVYKPASEYGEGTQIVRIDDFYDGRLVRRSGFKKVTLTNEEEADYAVAANDLIVNRVNSIEYLGKCALIPTLDAATVFESNIMRLRPADAAVRTDWLTRYLSSSAGQDRMRENAKHAVNQASINQNDVGLVLVPYCATEEQGEIVAVLDETLSAVETTDREIGDALRRVSALRQSILKQAFSGQLVPQEPTDEPAAALLARLREEAPTARPRRRRTA